VGNKPFTIEICLTVEEQNPQCYGVCISFILLQLSQTTRPDRDPATAKF